MCKTWLSFLLFQVFQDCGQPRIGKRQTFGSYSGYQHFVTAAADRSNNDYNMVTGTTLDILVTDIISKAKDTKGFWTRLPEILCQNPTIGTGKEKVEQNCWNGRDRGTYSGRVTGDGLAAQDQNPEVEVDIGRPDQAINEQILSLKLTSNMLVNANRGQPVKWPHYEESKFVSFFINILAFNKVSCWSCYLRFVLSSV